MGDEVALSPDVTVAALYVDGSGVYANLPGVEVWDEALGNLGRRMTAPRVDRKGRLTQQQPRLCPTCWNVCKLVDGKWECPRGHKQAA